jgi:hypothetical protein
MSNGMVNCVVENDFSRLASPHTNIYSVLRRAYAVVIDPTIPVVAAQLMQAMRGLA